MDSTKKMEELESKMISYQDEVANLKAQLAVAPTQADKEIIAQQLNRVYALMDGLQSGIIALVLQVQKQDPRPLTTNAWASIKNDPLLTGGGLLCATTTTMWLIARQYALARHRITPYSHSQLIWRKWLLLFDVKSVPNAQRLAGIGALLVVLRTSQHTPYAAS